MVHVSTAELHALLGALLFPFIRILALLFAAPLLGQRSVPVRLRLALALVLAFLAASNSAVPLPPLDAPGALAIALREGLIGFALGLLMRLIFAAAQIAGDAIGLQMGLGFAFFVDPQASGQSPLLGTFYATIAGLLFFALDVHLVLIEGLMESFSAFPVASPLGHAAPWAAVAAAGGDMFRLALTLCLPALTGLTLVNIALGMLSRSAPQLNLFAVGFPATLLVGALLLAPTLPGAIEALSRALAAWPANLR